VKYLESEDVPTHYEKFNKVIKKCPDMILPGIFDEWALAFREDLERRIIKIAKRVSYYHRERGEYIAAAEALESVIKYDDVDEHFHETIIDLYERAKYPQKS
jgi:DNA-binding SARP family transcriptional activator